MSTLNNMAAHTGYQVTVGCDSFWRELTEYLVARRRR
jgi:hypothetical protein